MAGNFGYSGNPSFAGMQPWGAPSQMQPQQMQPHKNPKTCRNGLGCKVASCPYNHDFSTQRSGNSKPSTGVNPGNPVWNASDAVPKQDQVKQLQDQIRQLQDQIRQLQDQNRQLKYEVQHLQQDNAFMLGKNNMLEAHNTNLLNMITKKTASATAPAAPTAPVAASTAPVAVSVPVVLTLVELTSKGLPANMDAAKKEQYLSDEEFLTVFEMTKAKFAEIPVWRQKQLKKAVGLF